MYRQKRFTRVFASCFVLSALFLLSLAACGTGNGGGGSNGGGSSSNVTGNISTPTSTGASPTASAAAGAWTVLSVDMAVSPHSLSSYTCGTNLTVTYTATFHLPANNPGGQIQFEYTTDNGRGSTQAGLTVQPGQTTVPYHFTWSGALPSDHTMPEPGGVIVSTPNALNSQLVGPSGSCINASAPFSVNSVSISASPSLSGHACGTAFIETYTATFHIAANGPGGTLVFNYTTNNGRSQSQDIHLSVAPGQTTATYKFYWKGTLPTDHTEPGVGLVMVTAPNSVISSPGVPQGQCTGA
ncbi:MAG TPA: hypothetical protein VF458_06040 [Ktedonobacteraceae bacterium]